MHPNIVTFQRVMKSVRVRQVHLNTVVTTVLNTSVRMRESIDDQRPNVKVFLTKKVNYNQWIKIIQ